MITINGKWSEEQSALNQPAVIIDVPTNKSSKRPMNNVGLCHVTAPVRLSVGNSIF